MRTSILALLCITTGCASTPTYLHTAAIDQPSWVVPVCLGSNLTDRVRQGAYSAIEEWNTALNGQVVLQAYDSKITSPDQLDRSVADKTIIVLENSDSFLMHVGQDQSAKGVHVLATTAPYGRNKPSAVIYLSDRLDNRESRYVIMHEIGHALGHFDHDGSPLMSLAITGTPCIDYQLMTVVSKYMRLDLNHLNYCR